MEKKIKGVVILVLPELFFNIGLMRTLDYPISVSYGSRDDENSTTQMNTRPELSHLLLKTEVTGVLCMIGDELSFYFHHMSSNKNHLLHKPKSSLLNCEGIMEHTHK